MIKVRLIIYFYVVCDNMKKDVFNHRMSLYGAYVILSLLMSKNHF
jgi:hypothetical protein